MDSYPGDFPFGIMDVVELLHLRIRRRQANSVYVDCPFCGDRRGKMNVNFVKNVWRCNYCDEHGGMLALYARLNNTTTSDAYWEIGELQAEEMEEKFPHVNAICQEIKAKYEYADADYMVVVPDGILDIITEGRALHHCAGSSDRYWDRIERRESFVMFLRKTADPFHAYYTLEVEPDGTVRQKRTEYDRQKKDIEQATEFLQKWQRVITARLTESDKALAAESRILREKEFIQLKKDRVIIHTGHLAGRLLADVLMADLMENTDSIQSPVLAAAA